MFGRGHGELIALFDRNLAGGVRTVGRGSRWQPPARIAAGLGPIVGRQRRHEHQRVVGEVLPPLRGPARRTGCPGVAERDHVVDVDLIARDRQGLTGIAVVQDPRLDPAVVRSRAEHDLRQVPRQGVVAAVAPVAIEVEPVEVEQPRVIARRGRRIADGQGCQGGGDRIPRRAGRRLPAGGLGRTRRRRTQKVRRSARAQDQHHDHRDHQKPPTSPAGSRGR